MKRIEEIKKILSENKRILKEKYKVKSLAIFGSYLRGEEKKSSDIDILVEFEDFVKDRKTYDAVLRNLEIIGEPSMHVPIEIKNKYKEIDWLGMQGLINRITHEYFGLSYKIIWKIIKEELSIIKEKLKEVLN